MFFMGQTSNQVKQQWNDAHYTQVKISVKPNLAKAFKAACVSANVSMALAISSFMAEFCDLALSSDKSSLDVSNRRKRRRAIQSIIQHLECVKSAEESYRDNIPANLQASSVFDNADLCVALLEEALESLNSAY
jgi:hypothetical protein